MRPALDAESSEAWMTPPFVGAPIGTRRSLEKNSKGSAMDLSCLFAVASGALQTVSIAAAGGTSARQGLLRRDDPVLGLDLRGLHLMLVVLVARKPSH
jgi:hypothetical protein